MEKVITLLRAVLNYKLFKEDFDSRKRLELKELNFKLKNLDA